MNTKSSRPSQPTVSSTCYRVYFLSLYFSHTPKSLRNVYIMALRLRYYKKDKNAYGELLDKLLDRKKDAKNPEKIRQALAAVESEKSPSGETYGDLLKEGKLP